ncbi:MAG: endo alpha-1,4 polygalactosaminidase [Campylobacterota bacterium]|nr:endo alpha-1,4 polygalactosaminidase [Campylobacterota bacterium]
MSWYQPSVSTTWQWQLSGAINTSYEVDLYDIDLFDTPQSTIDDLHARGIKVICYFSAGSYEEWREDALDFPQEALGNDLSGWPGERWLDIRNEEIHAIMRERLDLAKTKGCDGVEPDNVDGYTNNPGFDFDANDQLAYNIFLAESAHERDLSIALKNDLGQIGTLIEYFDFAVNEQCHEYDECELLEPFIQAGKAVFNAEYNERYENEETLKLLCEDARLRSFQTLYLPSNLNDKFRVSCAVRNE